MPKGKRKGKYGEYAAYFMLSNLNQNCVEFAENEITRRPCGGGLSAGRSKMTSSRLAHGQQNDANILKLPYVRQTTLVAKLIS